MRSGKETVRWRAREEILLLVAIAFLLTLVVLRIFR
jgi:hypothetical protein